MEKDQSILNYLSDAEVNILNKSLYKTKQHLFKTMIIQKNHSDYVAYDESDIQRQIINSILLKIGSYVDPNEKHSILTDETKDQMVKWLNKNPYIWHGAYNDELSDQQIDHIISGEFDKFWDSWNDHLFNIQDYADLQDLQDMFANKFELGENIAFWPINISQLFHEYIWYDGSELLKTCIKNTNTKIAVKPIKRSGNYVEFPNSDFDSKYNGYLQSYNKKYMGIENSSQAETCYSYDVLTLIGWVDLNDWLKAGRVPDFVSFGPEDFALTHNNSNGSGGLGDVIITKTRKMRAKFRHDKTDDYGVDKVFGFVGSVWRRKLTCLWS